MNDIMQPNIEQSILKYFVKNPRSCLFEIADQFDQLIDMAFGGKDQACIDGRCANRDSLKCAPPYWRVMARGIPLEAHLTMIANIRGTAVFALSYDIARELIFDKYEGAKLAEVAEAIYFADAMALICRHYVEYSGAKISDYYPPEEVVNQQ